MQEVVRRVASDDPVGGRRQAEELLLQAQDAHAQLELAMQRSEIRVAWAEHVAYLGEVVDALRCRFALKEPTPRGRSAAERTSGGSPDAKRRKTAGNEGVEDEQGLTTARVHFEALSGELGNVSRP